MSYRNLRRQFLAALAVACTTLGGDSPLFAQDMSTSWPTKPIRLVVGFAPGGGADIVARILAQPLSEALGQPVVVENKQGAGSTTAADLVAKSPKDGTVAYLTTSAHAIAASMYKALPFDPVKDFQPAAIIATSGLVLLVDKDAPFADVRALVAAAKAQPGKLNYGSIGLGSAPHFAAVLFRQAAGIDAKHIPYRSPPQTIAALRAKEIDYDFELIAPALGHIKSGDLRALGVTLPLRWPSLPNVPTIAEQGLAGFEVIGWWGVAFPAGTPMPIVAKTRAAVERVLADEGIKKRLLDVGALVKTGLTPEAFNAFIEADIAKWRAVRDKAGIEPQ